MKSRFASSAACFLAFIALAAVPAPAHGHPDLLLQIEQLDSQIAQRPDDAKLRLKRGDLYRRHGDYPEAAADFEAARAADPEDPDVDFFEGRLRLAAGDAAGAECLLTRFLKVRPGHAVAWILRGEAGIRLNEPGRAADYFAKAIRLSARPSPELYRQNILALAAAGDHRHADALTVVNAGLQRFPLEVSLLGLGADISLAEGRPQSARRYMARLPAPLLDLPRWRDRSELADCLAAPDTRTQCLKSAQASLARQIDLFLASTPG